MQTALIDQTAGKTFTWNFNTFAQQITANQGFSLPIQFPFITKNTNYTVEFTNVALAGYSANIPVGNNLKNKGVNGFTVLTSYNHSTNGIATCFGTISITFG